MRQFILVPCLVAGIAAGSFAGTRKSKAYSLTIKLAGSHDPVSTACTLVRTGERFELALTDGKIQTVLLGKVQRAGNEGFLLELELSQGNDGRWDFDSLGYELKLGGVGRPAIVYTRNHPGVEEPQVTLADGGCSTLNGA